jgi:hypothetical protein
MFAGAAEMRSLGRRVREYFPDVFNEPYLPKRYSIVSTQVPWPTPAQQRTRMDRLQSVGVGLQVGRAAASAVAFAQGCFADDNADSPAAAVALQMSPKDRDPLLRFFDMCPSYTQFKVTVQGLLVCLLCCPRGHACVRVLRRLARPSGPVQEAFVRPHHAALAATVGPRLSLPEGVLLSPAHVQALWTTCTAAWPPNAARVGACALFSAHEAALLEWLDDVAFLNERGWAAPLCYDMAAPLVEDMCTSLRVARGARTAATPRARLLFGHAESLAPLLCQLGLFGSPVEFPSTRTHARRPGEPGMSLLRALEAQEGALGEAAACDRAWLPGDRFSLQVPPKPPLPRPWRGAQAAPFAANLMAVVYSRANDSAAVHRRPGDRAGQQYVQLLFNERVVVEGIMAGSHDGMMTLDEFEHKLQSRISNFSNVCSLSSRCAG